jgi:molecular chaperone DnaJ
MEAVKGVKKEIRVRRHETCPDCSGSGAEAGTGRKTCTQCGGSGQLRQSGGFFSIARTCPSCSGEGSVIEKPCSRCRGTGSIPGTRKIKVEVPAGIDTGMRLRLAGEGDRGRNGGPPGDVYVIIDVRDHETFVRKGDDVYCLVPVFYTQLVFGDTLRIEGLEGHIELEIPAGTPSGHIFRLRSKGITHLGKKGRGDLFAKVRVEIPKDLDTGQKEILRRYEASFKRKPAEGKNDIVSKVKNFFH